MTPMAMDEKDINQVENEDTTTQVEDTQPVEESQDSAETTPQDEVEKLTKELADEKDKYLRLYAEFQNYRNRTTKEKTEAYNNATAKCIEEILPVIDNFERALTQECADENYKNGMELIFKNLLSILDKMGVKEIDAVGKPFDPNIHNAIQQIESDEYESDTVSAVFQKGYMLGERLVRPAMVQVTL
jgi:molecular chaperone GrpE